MKQEALTGGDLACLPLAIEAEGLENHDLSVKVAEEAVDSGERAEIPPTRGLRRSPCIPDRLSSVVAELRVRESEVRDSEALSIASAREQTTSGAVVERVMEADDE